MKTTKGEGEEWECTQVRKSQQGEEFKVRSTSNFTPEFKPNTHFINFLRLERADEVVEMPQAKVRFTCHAEKSRLRSRLMILFNFNIIYLPNIL